MSNAEFSISREHFKTIMQFVDFINKDVSKINGPRACLLLWRIEDEMRKYKNKECDTVVEVCQEMRITSYENGEAIVKALTKFSDAVLEVVSDEVFNSVYFI